jgi:hypothetical protein
VRELAVTGESPAAIWRSVMRLTRHGRFEIMM